jgi:hypothetical protein
MDAVARSERAVADERRNGNNTDNVIRRDAIRRV